MKCRYRKDVNCVKELVWEIYEKLPERPRNTPCYDCYIYLEIKRHGGLVERIEESDSSD